MNSPVRKQTGIALESKSIILVHIWCIYIIESNSRQSSPLQAGDVAKKDFDANKLFAS
jgi:hypothetical protein